MDKIRVSEVVKSEDKPYYDDKAEYPERKFYGEDVIELPSANPNKQEMFSGTAIEWGRTRMAVFPEDVETKLKRKEPVDLLDLGTGVLNLPRKIIKNEIEDNTPLETQKWYVLDSSGPKHVVLGENMEFGGENNFLQTGKRFLTEDLKEMGLSEEQISHIDKSVVPIQFLFGDPDSGPLPFKPEVFDAVYSSLAFHHLTDIQKLSTLKQVYEVLKPSGCMIFMDTFNTCRDGFMLTDKLGKKPPEHGKEYKMDILEFLKMIREAGFEVSSSIENMLNDKRGYENDEEGRRAMQDIFEAVHINPNIWTLRFRKPAHG